MAERITLDNVIKAFESVPEDRWNVAEDLESTGRGLCNIQDYVTRHYDQEKDLYSIPPTLLFSASHGRYKWEIAYSENGSLKPPRDGIFDHLHIIKGACPPQYHYYSIIRVRVIDIVANRIGMGIDVFEAWDYDKPEQKPIYPHKLKRYLDAYRRGKQLSGFHSLFCWLHEELIGTEISKIKEKKEAREKKARKSEELRKMEEESARKNVIDRFVSFLRKNE